MSLKQRIRNGEALFIDFVSLSMSEEKLAARAAEKPDMFFIDLQHGPYTEPQLVAFCATCAKLGIPPLVRARHPELHAMLGSYLDFGAGGVLVPMVDKEEVVEHSQRAFYYPPIGERSCGLQYVWGRAGVPGVREYADWWNENGVLAIQIETVRGVRNVRNLAKSGVDLILFGGNDLSFSLAANPDCEFASVAECQQYVCEQVAGLPVRVGVSDLPFGRFPTKTP
jgi:4-hydroxy-2-oxoheptanedioate aldolase